MGSERCAGASWSEGEAVTEPLLKISPLVDANSTLVVICLKVHERHNCAVDPHSYKLKERK